jgi:hypothetical protein
MIILFAILTTIMMVVVNILAARGAINGTTPGEVSALFPLMITPSGWVFSIWSVIYLGLGSWCVQLLLLLRSPQRNKPGAILTDCAPYVIGANTANIVWLLAWHMYQVNVALVVMLMLLANVVMVVRILYRNGAQHMPIRERITLLAPFELYMAWIIAATVINVSIVIWRLAIVPTAMYESASVGVLIVVAIAYGVLVSITRRIIYAVVCVWLFLGIATAEHSSLVETTAIVLGVLVIITTVVLGVTSRGRNFL